MKVTQTPFTLPIARPITRMKRRTPVVAKTPQPLPLPRPRPPPTSGIIRSRNPHRPSNHKELQKECAQFAWEFLHGKPAEGSTTQVKKETPPNLKTDEEKIITPQEEMETPGQTENTEETVMEKTETEPTPTSQQEEEEKITTLEVEVIVLPPTTENTEEKEKLESTDIEEFNVMIKELACDIFTCNQITPVPIEEIDLDEVQDDPEKHEVTREAIEEPLSEEEDETTLMKDSFAARITREGELEPSLGLPALPDYTVSRILKSAGFRRIESTPTPPTSSEPCINQVLIEEELRVTQHRPNILVRVRINGHPAIVTVDCGATRSVISKKLYDLLEGPKLTSDDHCILRDYQGRIIPQVEPPTKLMVTAGSRTREVTFCVGNNDTIAGLDFMSTFGVTIRSCADKFKVFVNPNVEDAYQEDLDEDQGGRTLQAYSEYAYADAQVIPPGVSTLKGSTYLPDGVYDMLDKHLPHLNFPDGVMVQGGRYEATIKNITAFPVTFFQDQKVARLCPLTVDKDDEICEEYLLEQARLHRIDESKDEEDDPLGRMTVNAKDLNGYPSNPYDEPTDDQAYLDNKHIEPGMPYYDCVNKEDWRTIINEDKHIPFYLKRELFAYLGQHDRASRLFAINEYDIGKLTLDVAHDIILDTTEAIHSKPYRLNPIFEKMLDNHMSFLEGIGHVTVGHSRYAQPAFVIPKKSVLQDYGAGTQCVESGFVLPEADRHFREKYGGGSKLRVIYDSRRLNARTRISRFTPPTIEDIYHTLGKAKPWFITVVDLVSGYSHVMMTSSAAEIASVITQTRQFLINRMCFGLRGAPATFLDVISRVLHLFDNRDPATGDLPFCLAYLDDIIIFSRTETDHIKHVKIVMDALLTAGLKIKASKVSFFRQEVELLGRIFDRNGLRVNTRTANAIKDFPRPFDILTVQRFLGLCAFVVNHLPSFHRKAFPLFSLLLKGRKFVWDDDCENAFRQLKKDVGDSLMLSFPPDDHDIYIAADASHTGMCAITYFIKSFEREEFLKDPPSEIYEKQFSRMDFIKHAEPLLPKTPRGGPKNFPLTTLADLLLAKLKTTQGSEEKCLEIDDGLIQRISKEGDKPVFSYLGEKDKIHLIFIVNIVNSTFSKTQRNWHIMEKECLALLRGIKAVEYLFYTARQVFVLQDSMCLVWLLSTIKTTQSGISKLNRWYVSLFASPLNLVIVPCSTHHNIADVLTRAIPYAFKVVRTKGGKMVAFAIMSPFTPGTVISFDELRQFVDEYYNNGGKLMIEDTEKTNEILEEKKRIQRQRAQERKNLLNLNKPEGLDETKEEENAPQESPLEGPKAGPSVSKIDSKTDKKTPTPTHEEVLTDAARLASRREDLRKLLSLDNIKIEQARDPDLKKLRKNMTPRYYVENDILYRKTVRADPMLSLPGRICVPRTLTPFALIMYHLDSHAGAARLEAQVTLKYFWKGLRKDCQLLTAGCHLCQVYNHDTQGKVRLAESHIPMIRNYHWSIDVLTIRQGMDVLVAVEHFSRYKVAIFMRQKSGAYLATLLEQHIFSVFGPPKTISSDNGRNLIRSKAMRQLLYEWGIQPSTTNPYAPHTHGQVERANLSIVVLLRKLLAQTKLPVERLLPRVVHILNTQPLPSLNNLSPLFVMTGLHPDEIQPIQEKHLEDPKSMATEWKRINRITKLYIDKANRAYEKAKRKIYQRTMNTPAGSYIYARKVGPEQQSKMSSRYHTEPQQVIKEYDTTVYARNFAGQVRQYHKNNVKPCPERVAHLFEQLPPTIQAIVGEAFTYEQFKEMAKANTYPEFYVQFRRRLTEPGSKILTRGQARQFIPLLEDDKIVPQNVDTDPLSDDEDDDLDKEDRHVTFTIPDQEPASVAPSESPSESEEEEESEEEDSTDAESDDETDTDEEEYESSQENENSDTTDE